MAPPTSKTPVRPGGNPVVFLIAQLYVIAIFAWRVLTPAHEYQMRADQVLTIGLDVALLFALFALRPRGAKTTILFWIAVAAGVGSLLLRLNGNAGWWTGHLTYYLEPR